MNLIQHIKNKRVRQRRKKPLKQDVFNQICSLVRRFGLGESFLNASDNTPGCLSGQNLEFARIRVKESFDFPLFALATKEEYHLIRSIINKFDNPYLPYAHSPEEILLSSTLFRLNPLINTEKLMHYHFETLLHYEYAKKHVTKLIEQEADNHPAVNRSCKPERTGNGQSKPNAFNRQIKKIQNFIEKVENIEKDS